MDFVTMMAPFPSRESLNAEAASLPSTNPPTSTPAATTVVAAASTVTLTVSGNPPQKKKRKAASNEKSYASVTMAPPLQATQTPSTSTVTPASSSERSFQGLVAAAVASHPIDASAPTSTVAPSTLSVTRSTRPPATQPPATQAPTLIVNDQRHAAAISSLTPLASTSSSINNSPQRSQSRKRAAPAVASLRLEPTDSDGSDIEDSDPEDDHDGLPSVPSSTGTDAAPLDDDNAPTFRFNLDFPYLTSTSMTSSYAPPSAAYRPAQSIVDHGDHVTSSPPAAAYITAASSSKEGKKRKRGESDDAGAGSAVPSSTSTPMSVSELIPFSPASFPSNTPGVVVKFATPPDSGPTPCRLGQLPTDWLYMILGYLNMAGVSCLARSSKYFQSLNDDRIWKGVCQANAVHPCQHNNHPWKQLAQTRMEKLRDRFKPIEERKYKKKYRYVCTCCKCVKGFELLSDYERHLEVRHGPNRTLPPLKKPRTKYLNPATGADVQKTQVGKDFICPILGCGKAFKKSIELKYHFDGVHRQERAFPCKYPGCFKSFVSPAQLSLHECKHTGADRPHKCSRVDIGCKKSFNTPSQLANHEQTHLPAGSRQMVRCPFEGCNREYHSKSAVHKHFATEHDESKLQYRCNDVNLMSIFVQSPRLEQIVSTCDAAFYFKATWKEHLVSKHRIQVTHQHLQQVVKLIKNNKFISKMRLPNGMPQNVYPHATVGSLPAGMTFVASLASSLPMTSTPQELAATAVNNAIRAANNGVPLPFVGGSASMSSMASLPSSSSTLTPANTVSMALPITKAKEKVRSRTIRPKPVSILSRSQPSTSASTSTSVQPSSVASSSFGTNSASYLPFYPMSAGSIPPPGYIVPTQAQITTPAQQPVQAPAQPQSTAVTSPETSK